MSALYKLRKGDDARDAIIDLTEDSAVLTAPVSSAILKITHAGETKERELEVEDSSVKYRFTDEDFEEFEVSLGDEIRLPCEVYATFSDGSNATFPTEGGLAIAIRGVM